MLVHLFRVAENRLEVDFMAKRSTEHRKAQKAGKERDNYTCQACGTKKDIEGHHIIDHQFYGNATVDNIVSLCHDCHKEVHRGNLNIVKF